MRLFHFTSSSHAISAIKDQRYKLSTYDNLNDPFELFAVDFSDRKIRRHFQDWKENIAKQIAFLCCSKSWEQTLLWSHYADKHKGAALELEVIDSCVSHINYRSDRSPITSHDMDEYVYDSKENAALSNILTTKADCWSYENEARVHHDLPRIPPDENGLHFFRFNDRVALKGIILGPLCTISIADIQAALPPRKEIAVMKARIAFRSFKVTEDLSFKRLTLVGAA